MKLIFASDSFKGSMTSEKISEILSKVAVEVFGQCETVAVVLADGGEGTLDSILSVRDGQKVEVTVHDPLMNEIKAYYGVFGDEVVIEMAQGSGLTLIPEDKRDPLYTSSIGTSFNLFTSGRSSTGRVVFG